MVTERPAEVLHGRRVEREALERLLDAVRRGRSRGWGGSGEPGVGKSALVEYAVGPASGVWGRAGGWRGVGDGACVRAVAAVVRAAAGSAGPASCASAGRAGRCVRAAGRGRSGSVS